MPDSHKSASLKSPVASSEDSDHDSVDSDGLPALWNPYLQGPYPTKRWGGDYVFVHGIAGPQRTTWTKPDSKLGLYDLIKLHLSRSTLLEFAERSYQLTPSWDLHKLDIVSYRSGIELAAYSLLDDMVADFMGSINAGRPVTIFAHDIGAIVVQKAILLARKSTEYVGVAFDIEKLVFFAAPTHASSLSQWTDLLTDLIYARQSEIRLTFSGSVSKLASECRRIAIEFDAIAHDYSILNVLHQGITTMNQRLTDEIVAQENVFELDKRPTENLILRSVGHFRLNEFYVEDSSWKIIGAFCDSSAIRPSDPYRRKYIEMLKDLVSSKAKPDPSRFDVLDPVVKWLVEHESVISWLECSKPAVLHVQKYSIPSPVVSLTHRLAIWQEIQDKGKSTVVAYFSFEMEQNSQRTMADMCLSLARQIVVAKPFVIKMLTDVYQDFISVSEVQRWEEEEDQAGWQVLRTVLACVRDQKLICVVDDVHLCRSGSDWFLKGLKNLSKGVETSFKFIIRTSSTSNLDYSAMLDNYYTVSMDEDGAHQALISQHVFWITSQAIKTRPWLSGFRGELESSLFDQKPTNFPETDLKLGCIQTMDMQSTEDSLKATLDTLSDQTTDVIFWQVTQKLKGKTYQWARNVLALMLHAYHPLRQGELSTLLAMITAEAVGQESSEDTYLPTAFMSDVTVLKPLYTTTHDGCIVFIHPDFEELTRKYLAQEESDSTMGWPSHHTMSHACLRYLTKDRLDTVLGLFRVGRYREDKTMEAVEHTVGWEANHLIKYAVTYWARHHRDSNDHTAEDITRITSFIENESWMAKWWDLALRSNSFVTPEVAPGSPLEFVAILGLEDVFKYWQKTGSDKLDLSRIENAVFLAITYDQTALLRLLLELYDKSEIKPFSLQKQAEYLTTWNKTIQDIIRDRIVINNDDTEGLGAVLKSAALIGDTKLVQRILESPQAEDISRTHMTDALGNAAIAYQSDLVRTIFTTSQLESIKGSAFAVQENFAVILSDIAINADEETLLAFLETERTPVNWVDSFQRTVLHWTSMFGNVSMTELLLAKFDAEVNARDLGGRTPLHWAAKHGFSATISVLMSAGADIDAEDDLGETPIVIAVDGKHVEVVQQFLNAGAKLTAKSKVLGTLLHVAVSTEVLGLVEILPLDMEGIEELDQKGDTPLLQAVHRNSVEIVKHLVQRRGANIDVMGSDRLTSLLWASSSRHFALCECLLDLGANKEDIDSWGMSALHRAAESGDANILELLLDKGIPIDRKTMRNRSALHYAAQEGNFVCVKLLLERGATPDLVDDTGNTPLNLAAAKEYFMSGAVLIKATKIKDTIKIDDLNRLLHAATRNASIDHAKRFVKAGAAINSRDETNGNSLLLNAMIQNAGDFAKWILSNGFVTGNDLADMWDCINQAIIHDNFPVFELLMKDLKDIDIEKPGRKGTFLHTAAEENRPRILNWLLDAGADMHALRDNGQTPLYISVEGYETVKILLERGANVKARGGAYGLPLLAAAARSAQGASDPLKTFDLLIEYGASVLDKDDQGRSTIHVAAQSYELRVLKYFVEKDREGLTRKDKQGRYPLHHALGQGRVASVDYILSQMTDADLTAPEFTDVDGWTPLHWASRTVGPVLPKRMLERGVSLSQKNSSGWGAQDVCIYMDGGDESITMLRSWGLPTAEVDKLTEQDDHEKTKFEQDTNGKSEEENVPADEPTSKISPSEGPDSEKAESESSAFADEGHVKPELRVDTTPSDKQEGRTSSVGSSEHVSKKSPVLVGGFPQRHASTTVLPDEPFETTCDGCNWWIYGPLYKCTQCGFFHYCFKCAWTRDQTHPEHVFEVIEHADEEPPRYESDIVKEEVSVDSPHHGTTTKQLGATSDDHKKPQSQGSNPPSTRDEGSGSESESENSLDDE